MTGETRALANFCSNLNFDKLPQEAVDKAKECLLDWLGSALGGSNLLPAVIVSGLIKELGGSTESTIINHVGKTSCINAALANGVMSHILELDDVHRNSIIHPAAPVIPAALALAERNRANGKVLTTAIVVGYEAAIRIGEAVGPSHYKFWHNTGTCGTFGAATASGKVLGLNEEWMANALGTAGTQASGLWQFMAEGAMSKHLHPGRAAMNGVLSALLAERRFTGSTTILEGERGFCLATSSNPKFHKITEDLGKKLKILETSFKVHASCRHTHSPVDAIMRIQEDDKIAIEDIASVRVETYPDAVKIAGNNDPRTPYEAKFSLKYCVSTALSKGRLSLDEFSESLIADREIRGLMERCEIVVNPKLSDVYPARWPSIVEIVTKNGKRYKASVDYPRGDPENAISVEELTNKFRTLAIRALSEDSIEKIINAISRLEEMSDVRQLTKLLRTR